MARESARWWKSRRLQELGGILVCIGALVAALALLSYDAEDATWFHRQADGVAPHNWIGRFGATVAEALLQLFGTASFLLPALAAVLGGERLRQRGPALRRLGGFALLTLALAAMLDLVYPGIHYGGDDFPAGGYAGARLAGLARGLLNVPGA
ncbi:MAG TPA: DNA translocase FtsK 4TM domain-containing protein, partial [Candidatus Polarisedimenticolaceae bacterium]|nr:DNA translocase FtsK 4TM domain-containing protein [Candidatus Polarisedimenticolaceae bacterium]